MRQWIRLVFIGFCAISSMAHASPDFPAGSYLITSYGDDNILDGIQLYSQTMDLIISTIDGLNYTATYGIGGPQLSMVRDGYLLSQYPRPQDFGSGWATNAYILSDGVNGAWVHMGQEYDNLNDISIYVATWMEDVEVTASQLVGKWIMQGIDDTNLLSNPSAPFNMITYTWLVTDLGSGLLDMYMVEEDAHWNMQLNGNVLEPVSTTPIDAWHAYVSMMTNGQTIVFAVLSTELYDETDVSPFIGFATRDNIDIDWIWFKIEKDYKAGTPDTEPYNVGALVSGTNLNSVEVTSPTGITEALEQGDNYWTWDREETYATLEDLYDDFPPGDYLFVFNKDEENEDSVIISFEPEQQPTGFGNVTYPADGAINVELNPTFTWDSCSGYGDNLFVVVVDDDEDVYWDNLDIEQVSWTPGPLVPGHLFEFEIIVENTGEMTSSTENGDTFNFIDVFQWTNEIRFTTEPLPSDLDIEMLGISATKQFRDGVPQGELPWSLDIMVKVENPDNLHHINVTKPGDSAPFVTLYEEVTPAGMWGCSLDDDYPTLTDLRDVYKDGTYKFEFRTIDNALIRNLNIDYTDLPIEPAGPVDFIYPYSNGQTGISVNPTFMWSVSPEAGDALMMAVDNDEVVYFDAPVPMSSTSWAPGNLSADHQYELDVFVVNIKDWAVGPDFPTMTDSTGDTFSYAHTIEYLNEIVFTTALPSADPIDEIEEILDLVDESVEDGTLTGEGPGNSGDNRLNALINMLEEAQSLIDAGLYEESCDQLWSIYKKCDGESRPPDFVTGEAAEVLADMILLMMDDLGC